MVYHKYNHLCLGMEHQIDFQIDHYGYLVGARYWAHVLDIVDAKRLKVDYHFLVEQRL